MDQQETPTKNDKCHDWDEDIRFAKVANPLWKSYLKRKLSTDNVVSLEENLTQQFMGVGDFLVDGNLRMEIKTRKEWAYHYYGHDVAFETNANVEWNRIGSAFTECKADLFGYGFLVDGNTRLKDPRLYVVKPLQTWFDKNHHRYEERHAKMSNNKYHSTFKSIPKKDIKCFEFN